MEYNHILPDPSVLRNHILNDLKEPVLFCGLIDDWSIVSWTVEDWAEQIGNELLSFRVGQPSRNEGTKEPQWEGKCTTIDITMNQFIEETALPSSERNRWLYFDYKHMNECFKDNPAILQAVNWKNFGFPERTGADSTLWIGNEGAHTPCHFDTYGCNLVAQILGRKQWILVPPEETASMLPTRIPYEESSVYSSWNFTHPDPSIATEINGLRVVTLNPGDVLFVPRHWWHYVESMETAVSVNTWIPLPGDDVCRLEESLVRLFIGEVCKDIPNPGSFLNPNELDLIDCPLSISSSLVENSLVECNQSCENRTDPELNAQKKPDHKGDQTHHSDESNERRPNALLELSRFVSIVPKCSPAEVLDVFARKHFLKRTIEVTSQVTDDPKERLLKKIINAFCQPDVISLVRQKLQM